MGVRTTLDAKVLQVYAHVKPQHVVYIRYLQLNGCQLHLSKTAKKVNPLCLVLKGSFIHEA